MIEKGTGSELIVKSNKSQNKTFVVCSVFKSLLFAGAVERVTPLDRTVQYLNRSREVIVCLHPVPSADDNSVETNAIHQRGGRQAPDYL